MLASSLMLLLSLPVSVSFCLSPSVFAAWLWLLSWGLCPPGVLGTTLVDLCSFCEDMRSMYAFAPEPSSSSCPYAGPGLFWFPALFSFLVCRFPSRLACTVGRAGSLASGLVFQSHQKILDKGGASGLACEWARVPKAPKKSIYLWRYIGLRLYSAICFL